jgi:hypothetical protein
MAKKEGWQKGLGRFAKDGPNNGPKVVNGPGDDPEAPYKNWSDQIYNEDYPIRGVRKGFS